jgi:hypothetical protein
MDGGLLSICFFWLLAYLILVFPLALVLATIVPLGQVADEPAHALRAGSVAQGHLAGRRGPFPPSDASVVISGMDSDAGLTGVMSLFAQRKKATAEAASKATQIDWDHKPTFFPTASVASYFPIFYLPAAAVLAVAQHNHIKPMVALRAARLANVIVATLGRLVGVHFDAHHLRGAARAVRSGAFVARRAPGVFSRGRSFSAGSGRRGLSAPGARPRVAGAAVRLKDARH